MNKKYEKLFVAGAAILVILALVFIPSDYGYLALLTEPFTPPIWDELSHRDVVKNAILLTLVEQIDENCKVTAPNFLPTINHEYFVRGSELANKLNFDENDQTLLLPCDQLVGEKSKLHIWYATEEAEKHATKYEYFITSPETELGAWPPSP